VAAGLWLISVFIPSPARYVLWALGLIVDLATPYRMRRIQATVPLDVAHLPERFGLFTILVLGESIAAVVAGLSHEGWKLQGTILAALAVLATTGLWWVYFDNLDGTVVRRRAEQRTAWRPTVWIYSHLPLVIALITTAIGLEHAISHASKGSLPVNQQWLLTGGMAAVFAILAVIELATEPSGRVERQASRIRLRLVGTAAVLIIGLSGQAVGPLALVLLLTLVCAGQVAGDVVINGRFRTA
jgi:low temperature requirement protein LtrA